MAFRGRRAAAGSGVNSILTSHNGNQFTDGARACWSLGSIHFVSTLFSSVFGQGWRGIWSPVRYKSKMRFVCVDRVKSASRAMTDADSPSSMAFLRNDTRTKNIVSSGQEANFRATLFVHSGSRNGELGCSKIRSAAPEQRFFFDRQAAERLLGKVVL